MTGDMLVDTISKLIMLDEYLEVDFGVVCQ